MVRRLHPRACGVYCSCWPASVVIETEVRTSDEDYAAWLDAAIEADAHPTAEVPATLYADRLTVTDGDTSFVSILLSGAIETVHVETSTLLTRTRSRDND